jgi:hypothetical protein
MVGKRFNLYRHPFQPTRERVVRVEKAVTIVAGKGEALAIHSLLEPGVHLSMHRARRFTTMPVTEAHMSVRLGCERDFASYWLGGEGWGFPVGKHRGYEIGRRTKRYEHPPRMAQTGAFPTFPGVMSVSPYEIS